MVQETVQEMERKMLYIRAGAGKLGHFIGFSVTEIAETKDLRGIFLRNWFEISVSMLLPPYWKLDCQTGNVPC